MAGDSNSAKDPSQPLGRFAEPSPHERRREGRFPCGRVVSILPVDGADHEPVAVELVDCAVNGVGLSGDKPMQVGDRLLVQLDDATQVAYVVRRWHTIAPGRYHIGAAFAGFLERPDAAPDQTLLRRLLQGADPARP